MATTYSPGSTTVQAFYQYTTPTGMLDNLTTTHIPNECANVSYPGLVNFSEQYLNYHGYIAAVVCIFGIAANLANIIVLTRKSMISSTNMILTWLAVADLLTMMSYLPVSIHFYILRNPNLHFPTSTSYPWIHFMLFHVNFSVVCHTIAIWLTIALAIFRYLFICCPTRGAELCSMQRAKVTIALIFALTAVICIPNYLVTAIKMDKYEPPDISINATNLTGSDQGFVFYTIGDSKLGATILSTMNYWIQACCFKLIPCGLLTVLTILLIIAMHQAHKRRMTLISQGKKDESERAREHNRTTAMLLAIVGLFLLTELPQGILAMCNIFINCFFFSVYWPLGDLLDIAALLNNAINFVLYCSMSRQFRDTFRATFCPKKKMNGWLKVRTTEVPPTEATTV